MNPELRALFHKMFTGVRGYSTKYGIRKCSRAMLALFMTLIWWALSTQLGNLDCNTLRSKFLDYMALYGRISREQWKVISEFYMTTPRARAPAAVAAAAGNTTAGADIPEILD